MTLVELLVVLVIFGVVLSLLTAFFSGQVRLTSRTQAGTEVEVKARAVAESLVQDIQMAGSRAVFDGAAVEYALDSTHCTSDASDETWTSDQSCARSGDPDVLLQVLYATSLRAGMAGTSPCRSVAYRLVEGTLSRSDVSCGDAPAFHELASHIDQVSITWTCADGSNPSSGTVEGCYVAGDPDQYPRHAAVQVTARSDNRREDITSTMELSTSMPNLRSPVTFAGSEGEAE